MNDLRAGARIGIVHPMAYPDAGTSEKVYLSTARAILADVFFDAIEVTHAPTPDAAKQLRAMAECAGVTVYYAAQPAVLGDKLDLGSADAAERARALGTLKGAIDEASEMGARGFAVLSGPDPGPGGREEGWRHLEESLRDLCKYSTDRDGPALVLETFDRMNAKNCKNCLAGPTSEAARLAESVRADFPSFGLLLDLSHLPLLGETPRSAVLTAGAYLTHAHMGNCVLEDPDHAAFGDVHPRFGIAGGANDVAELAEFLGALDEVGFLDSARRPPLSFEVKPMPGEDSALVIANAQRALVRAWALVDRS